MNLFWYCILKPRGSKYLNQHNVHYIVDKVQKIKNS